MAVHVPLRFVLIKCALFYQSPTRAGATNKVALLVPDVGSGQASFSPPIIDQSADCALHHLSSVDRLPPSLPLFPSLLSQEEWNARNVLKGRIVLNETGKLLPTTLSCWLLLARATFLLPPSLPRCWRRAADWRRQL